MTRITGRVARELLDAWEGEESALRDAREDVEHGFGYLFEAAPDLAETVAWLYGREPDEGGFSHQGSGWEVEEMQGEIDVLGLSAIYTPDEAVDLARALLAAAEEARHG